MSTPSQERRDLLGSAPKSSGRTVSGYACLFNVRSQNLSHGETPLFEVVLPGAFDGVLKDDVRALVNHDSNLVLARSRNGAGTLKLTIDAKGLHYRFTAPNTQAGNDLLENIRLQNLDQSSYSFTVDPSGQKYTIEGKATVRTISKFSRLFDVSPVTFPATTETSVSARSKGKPYDIARDPRHLHFKTLINK
jgi:HK97 family phage prohead protease